MSLVLDQQVQTVLGWLDQLPAGLARERPIISTIRALGYVFSNRPDEAEASLNDAERCLEDEPTTDEARAVLGRVAAIRAAICRFSGDIERSVSLGHRALQLLPETDATLRERASARTHVALTYQVNGEVHLVNERSLEEAVAAFSAAYALVPLLNSINRLGKFRTMQGRLRAAHATYERAAAAVLDRVGQPAAVNSAAYYAGMGEIHLQWNDLDSAERYLHQAVDLVAGDLTVDADAVTESHLCLARVHLAGGHSVEARATLDQFVSLARRRRFFHLLIERGEAAQARLALQQHDLAAAIGWADGHGNGRETTYTREEQHLTLARVLIARSEDRCAGSLQAALLLLDRMFATASAAGRTNSVIEVLVLRALALQAQQERTAAIEALERALVLADVATSTVKSYTNSIFRRLRVRSRTQAVAEARALHLLAD
jgi:LuxR family transcriptional regulator, maltose regulon positive regulatory protein